MLFSVVVGVALVRSPVIDEYRKVVVDASSGVEAQLIACQICACSSVMPVCSELVDTSCS